MKQWFFVSVLSIVFAYGCESRPTWADLVLPRSATPEICGRYDLFSECVERRWREYKGGLSQVQPDFDTAVLLCELAICYPSNVYEPWLSACRSINPGIEHGSIAISAMLANCPHAAKLKAYFEENPPHGRALREPP